MKKIIITFSVLMSVLDISAKKENGEIRRIQQHETKVITRKEKPSVQRHKTSKKNTLKENQSREEEAQLYIKQDQEKKGYYLVNNVHFQMIPIPSGKFAKGKDSTAHEVTIPSFFIGKTEVTQELWVAVMGTNPSKFIGKQRPVECVSWDDCLDFIHKLNLLTGKNFRLPTETEWEFAASGGIYGKGYQYAGSNTISNVAWYNENSMNDKHHEVATKSSNELGLYDMSGNVWEWCADKSTENSSTPNNRICRGGAWIDDAMSCSIVSCSNYPQSYRGRILGFRLAL